LQGTIDIKANQDHAVGAFLVHVQEISLAWHSSLSPWERAGGEGPGAGPPALGPLTLTLSRRERGHPQDLTRGGAPHGKVAAQRHRTARDRDLRRDPGDLPRPCPTLQLLDTVGVHPETAAPTADVPTTG